MKINKLYIKGLFGEFDYLLNFKDINDNIIILTAPNGYGKSTILKILDDFFNNKFYNLFDECFDFFELEFDDKKIIVEKTDSTLIVIYNEEKNNLNEKFYFKNSKNPQFIIKNELPFMRKIANDTWIDNRDNEILNTKDVISRYCLFDNLEDNENHRKLFSLLNTNVFFVETTRLVDSSFLNNDYKNSAIQNLSNSILDLIKDVKQKQYYISMDQSSDFPTRVMSLLSDNINIDVPDVVNEIIKITKFDRTYNKNGIFGNLNLDPKIIGKLRNEEIYNNKSFLLVLSSYLQDIVHRVNACSELAERINLFKKSVNSLLQFKSIDINPKHGIIVTKNKNKEDLAKDYCGDFSIDLLSSGEQHLIILLGNLIFNTKFGTLILIDEPEISLHAAWQKKLLNLISKIAKINNFNILIATHSFTLINGDWDRTIELAELHGVNK